MKSCFAGRCTQAPFCKEMVKIRFFCHMTFNPYPKRFVANGACPNTAMQGWGWLISVTSVFH